ncbi:ABC transporter ATP-binding protein [Nitriliruptor alkaliphilus]|uniref:ABC transporter ATP-binding protein n=1 Tax=Nitriliruptor alkaliphilus TaxID=427918 RepID=UPI000A440DE4|nr:ABC transporter ATP-binding protein [Nitriliruptor alkaliphilus]
MVTLDLPNATTRTSALACRGLVKRYGTTLAVDGVDLEVERGSLTALLGPSGCGKTTVLRMIAGLLAPDEGAITIDGREVAGPRTHVPPEKRAVGLVFQDYALFPHLSVARNVAFGLGHLPRRERRDRVGDVLDLVGLGDLHRRLPTALSGGQQQRVALARALAPSPELVLLDEPFSGLDAALRATVREEVRSILRAADATAVVVTHDQEEALSLADRVAVMDRGRIHQLADPQTLYTRPATRFVAGFVGEADILPAERVDSYLVDTPLGRLPTMEAVAAEHVAAVIRPESLQVTADLAGSATVTGIEYFGHDQLVHLRLDDGTQLRARRGPILDLQRSDRVRIDLIGPIVTFGPGTA